jgi:hypothetical protein
MKINSTSALATVAATAAIAGATLTATPAKAASLGPGTFVLTGQSTITTTPTGLTINFSNFGINSSTGTLASLSGTPTVFPSLSLTGSGSSFSSSGQAGFIQGLNLGGNLLNFDLNPFTANSVELLPGIVQLTSSGISGTLSGGGNSVLGQGALASINFNSGAPGVAVISVQTIPTPALLPGLIGLGVGIVRKRQSEASGKAEA